MTPTAVYYKRIGPVFLWWSEYDESAVIGPSQGAWGGDDIFHCDACPEWRGEYGEAITHAASTHGIRVAPEPSR
jgi:hypothetical protein